MSVVRTGIAEVVLLEPKVFGDARGWFFGAYNKGAFRDATGLESSSSRTTSRAR